jgi:hypothetical protein
MQSEEIPEATPDPVKLLDGLYRELDNPIPQPHYAGLLVGGILTIRHKIDPDQALEFARAVMPRINRGSYKECLAYIKERAKEWYNVDLPL